MSVVFKEKFHIFLLPYVAGFAGYHFLTVYLAKILLSSPPCLFVYWGVILVIISAVCLYQKHYFYPRRPILYEKVLESYLVTFSGYLGTRG